MADLPPPVRVSPLIRFGRWSFLIVGVLYGASRQSRLSKREAILREEEAKNKVIRDAKLAEEKNRMAKEELRNLAKAAGITDL